MPTPAPLEARPLTRTAVPRRSPPPQSAHAFPKRRPCFGRAAGWLLPALLLDAALAGAVQSPSGARLVLDDLGLDPGTGTYRVELLNEDERRLTAAGVEIFVAAPDGSSHLRGMAHDRLEDRWVGPGQRLPFEIEVGTVAEPDLWAFEPRLVWALFEDLSWVGEESRVERALLGRAAGLRESRQLMARLAATTPRELRGLLEREARRGERAGRTLDLISFAPDDETPRQPDRAVLLAAARGTGRQARSWADEAKSRDDDAHSLRIYLSALDAKVELLAAGSRSLDLERLEKVAREEER